jgi:hypothetical protein
MLWTRGDLLKVDGKTSTYIKCGRYKSHYVKVALPSVPDFR